jgi:type IV pilus assembly protein PilP
MRPSELKGTFGALLLCFAVLGGCLFGGGEGPVAPTQEEVKVAVVPEVVVAEEAPEVYSYSSIGKRDPFRSFIQKEVVVSHDGGVLGPLQIHEIDSYTLTGIIANPSAPYALVRGPDGTGHVVELGTLVGRNWGKVTEIKPGEIVITEEYRDPIENELIIHEVKMAFKDISDD